MVKLNYVHIAVIDGQGGGIGKNIIEKLRKELLLEVEMPRRLVSCRSRIGIAAFSFVYTSIIFTFSYVFGVRLTGQSFNLLIRTAGILKAPAVRPFLSIMQL